MNSNAKGQPPAATASDTTSTASDEQAERLRAFIVKNMRLHFDGWSVSDDGVISDKLLSDLAYEIHVLPLDRLTELIEEIDSYEQLTYGLLPCGHFSCYLIDHGIEDGLCALCQIERQAALIEKVRAAIAPTTGPEGTSFAPWHKVGPLIIDALAEYDRETKGAKS